MRKVKCQNGHFYNAERFDVCPICGAEGQELAAPAPSVPAPEEPVPAAPSLAVDELAPTQLLFPEEDPLRSAGAVWDAPAPEPEAPPEPVSSPPAEEAPSVSVEEFFPAASPEPAPEEPAAPPEADLPAPPEEEPEAEELPAQEPEASPQEEEPTLAEAVSATGAADVPAFPGMEPEEPQPSPSFPPVGWLVCLKGAYAGQAFPCREGKNRIGRALGLEIVLPRESAVSRTPHAILIYEPRQRQFFLQAGPGEGLTYLNDALLFDHAELHAYDRISLGRAEFLFLPLCGPSFSWDGYLPEE